MATHLYRDLALIEKQSIISNGFHLGENFNKSNLTKRELEVLSLIVLGHTAKEVGQYLSISFRTVEAYINTLKFKLGCQSKREIIKMVIKTGLVFKLGLLEN